MPKRRIYRQSMSLFVGFTALVCQMQFRSLFSQDEVPLIADMGEWIQATIAKSDQISPRTPVAFGGQDVPGMLLSEMQECMESPTQVACLKILVEHFPMSAAKRCLEIAEDRNLYVDVRQRATWIAGLLRVPDWEARFEKLLDDPKPEIQAAAIDALGMLRTPPYDLIDSADDEFRRMFEDGPDVKRLTGDPSIVVVHLITLGGSKSEWKEYDDQMIENLLARKVDHKNYNREIPIVEKLTYLADRHLIVETSAAPLPERIIEKLRRIAATTDLVSLRSAAARALVACPPENYSLRYAEWGVFISSDKNLELPKSMIDEIPPFVHLTQVPLDELEERINPIMLITKPVIHLTVDQPLAIDVEVAIRRGAVWFSYPKPNEILPLFGGASILDKQLPVAEALSKVDHGIPRARFVDNNSADNFHDGYPWLFPAHRRFGKTSGGIGSENLMSGAGAKWQFLYVSPETPPGTTPPAVGDEYKWWRDLRDVSSSWIAAGNEAERFLYYDGPTLLPSTLNVTTDGDQVKIEYKSWFPVPKEENQRVKVSTASSPRGILIEVGEDRIAKAMPLDLSQPQTIQWPADMNWHQTEVIDQTRKFLMDDFGLLKSEADGLLKSWSKQFFETPGRRIIARITRVEYDYCCPFTVRPLPTEISRVGLILHELPK